MSGFAQPPAGWMAQPRMEYGWPIAMVRVFDEPTAETLPGRCDFAAMIVNVFAWAFVAAVCCMPILAGRYRRMRSRLHPAKGDSAPAKEDTAPAKSFQEHLQEQGGEGI